MVSGIGKNITNAFTDVMMLVAIVVTVLIILSSAVTRWYYYDTILLGMQVEVAKDICERRIKRDEHCKVTISANPID